MAKKFYVVWAGRETGIFTSWDYTKKQVDKFPQAKYKSFPTEAEAKAAFGASASKSIGKAAFSAKSKASTATKTTSTSKAKIDLSTHEVMIFTDGGCEPNPGKAGSGMAIYRNGAVAELWFGLYNPNGTNNSAELNALYQAILVAQKAIKANQTVKILSDSQYSINCITNWAYGWKSKGWKRKTAGDIANLEVIKQAHELYDAIKDDMEIEHVAAHVGIEGNELADRMSIYAIDKKLTGFVKYDKALDVAAILSLRTG
ncbi:ribonuclease H family protein [Shewanella sp. 4_MG-2023]|uniref:ribonuclease H family protein n=1 Tax=Shewanella sp. 4_MG-2023 TaxID=3062652 RepID=UPI0026E20C54|nr:ribonuclease H family protein [Shewanella sp. 4_MG-2023]MDO6678311.1 ribonuclease H family protein [Shewanella sp. 4_MG-2023]